MEFCDNCESLMAPQDGAWVCPNGHEGARDSGKKKPMVMTEGQESGRVVNMSNVDNADIGPTTRAICPKYGHDVARYEMKQIRSADESEARFFACAEYDHKWRESDH